MDLERLSTSLSTARSEAKAESAALGRALDGFVHTPKASTRLIFFMSFRFISQGKIEMLERLHKDFPDASKPRTLSPKRRT